MQWWAALQHGSTTNGKLAVHHLAVRTLTLWTSGAALCCTRQTRCNRPMNITMFRAAVMAGFTELQVVCTAYEAVTAGRVSSLVNLILRGGVQILQCAAAQLSGSVAIMLVKILHSGAQYPWRDAKDTLISNLSEQSTQTEDTSVRIGFEPHFKPPSHVVWIWSAKDQISHVFLLFRLPETNLDTIWIFQKSNLDWQSEQGLRLQLQLKAQTQRKFVSFQTEFMQQRIKITDYG